MSFFDQNTINLLDESLSSDAIKTREGTGKTILSYLPSFHVIEEANRIFGFGMWGTEIMHIHQVDKTEYEKPPYKAGDPPKEMVSISYLCHLKLTVTNGKESISHEDTGFGNGAAGNTAHGIGSCIELASKEAVTDALKRCLRYYGSKFGLTLYDKDDNRAVEPTELENAKIVTDEQLNELRALYEARGIDDEWVLFALKAEHYPHDRLELMRQDWYQLALDITTRYKLDEINAATYKDDAEKIMKLMRESANMNMLKALLLELRGKAAEQKDKETYHEAVKLFEEIKEKLEGK